MTEQTIEFRHVNLGQLETRLDGDGPGSFEGYASRHGVTDSYGTRWQAGSWKRGGLDEQKYALLDMHDPKKRIGWFYATEDEEGLYIRGEYSKTQAGQDARIEAAEGIANELSVGFTRKDVSPDDSNEFTASRLVEVSQITARMASQPGAELAMVRAAGFVTELLDDAAVIVDENNDEATAKEEEERMDAETIDARYAELEKRWGESYVGSYEHRIRLVGQAVRAWTLEQYPRTSTPSEDVYVYAYPEATYSDRVLVNVEDKEGTSAMLFDYELDTDGKVALSNPRAAKVTTTVSTEGAESRSVEEDDNDAAEPEDAEQRLAELNARLVQARIATTKIA